MTQKLELNVSLKPRRPFIWTVMVIYIVKARIQALMTRWSEKEQRLTSRVAGLSPLIEGLSRYMTRKSLKLREILHQGKKQNLWEIKE